jgi:hypothetical protein
MSATITGTSRRRIAAAGLALTAAIGIAGVTSAAPASAAGPNILNSAGENVNFPTWVFGSTTVCATNMYATTYGYAAVRPFGAFYSTTLSLPPSQTRCVSGNWGGFPVNIANAGRTPIRVYSY